ncbi:MAG TPA: ABC transporter substrate-binding protein [Candidatus Mediterraneibacter stercoripullorum]|nr:ABC transporter substrate-binding protein [Candidatus Mediterraneibacter stercoripullorum]
MKTKYAKLTAALLAAAMLTGCSGGNETNPNENLDLNSMSVEEITAKAQEEGEVNSAGMPDEWANWKDTWDDIQQKYGLEHIDTDLSSAEELSLFETEKDDATKDIGDVGETYAAIAEEQGLTLKYKTSYWDEIPDWAKDDDGDWIIAYYGTMALLTNTRLVEDAPTSFQDILEGDYVVSIGDVARSTRAQYAVLAAAYAMGGDESNIQPGLDFFRQLAEQGRLDKGEFNLSRLEKGEIGVAIIWDFVGIGYREQIIENNPNAEFYICIPEEGSVQSGYSTIINTYTKRPYAAALTREYILSDEGQLNLAEGYARTVRDVELPEELQAKMIPDEQYQNVHMVEDQEAWSETVQQLPVLWNEQVMAYAQ